jgi:copper chaperone
MNVSRLKIEGMSCSHCVNAVESALKREPGVTSAVVNLGEGTAEVTYDEGRVRPEQLVAAVRAEGYGAELGASPGQ